MWLQLTTATTPLPGPSPCAHLSLRILQVGPCRPCSTRRVPASPSALFLRLSSVREELAFKAELMSLQRSSVRPQSSSLPTEPSHFKGQMQWPKASHTQEFCFVYDPHRSPRFSGLTPGSVLGVGITWDIGDQT